MTPGTFALIVRAAVRISAQFLGCQSVGSPAFWKIFLLNQIRRCGGGTHHQVELCVIVPLASNNRFQLDFDIRVSRLNTLFHLRPPCLFRIGRRTKLLISDSNGDRSVTSGSRRATASLQYSYSGEKQNEKRKWKETQAFQ